VVVAEPGQEIRVVVPNTPGNGAGPIFDSRVSPRPPTDSRVSPRPPTDSRVSPRPPTDSRVGPNGVRDLKARDPLGFGMLHEPAYSPRPVTIVAQPGQEIHLIIRDHTDAPGLLVTDSRVSPRPPVDSRVSPKPPG
jgi:hypothetical protein